MSFFLSDKLISVFYYQFSNLIFCVGEKCSFFNDNKSDIVKCAFKFVYICQYEVF